jgi:stearoyl-CoA desaturase (Delta-9 desaturase)
MILKLKSIFKNIIDIVFNPFTQIPIIFLLPNPSYSIGKIATGIVCTYIYTGICMSVCLHRYFSHKAFKTSRFGKFCLAILGSLTNQKGILWWASMHNKHHKFCDKPEDPHSLIQKGIFHSYCGWLYYENETYWKYVSKDFYLPELYFLNYFHFIPQISLIYLLWTYINYSWCFYLYILPSTISCLSILKFNLTFHPIKNDKKCKSIDKQYTLGAYFVGEQAHLDHHKHPKKYKRPGIDLPYYLFIYPLMKLGLIW